MSPRPPVSPLSPLSALSPLSIGSRILAATLGGYALTWGFIALGAMALFAGGMDLGEAQALVFLLGFLLFLAAFCWAFACRSLARVWGVLAGGGGVMTLAGWLLSRVLMP